MMRATNIQIKNCHTVYTCDAKEGHYKIGDVVIVDTKTEGTQIGEVISDITAVANFAYDVVLLIEVATNDVIDSVEQLKSKDKLKAAVEVFDDFVSLPWYLEIADGPAIELLLTFAVNYLNRTYGDDWNLNKIRSFIKQGKDFFEGFVV